MATNNYTQEIDEGITCPECANLRRTMYIGTPPKCSKHRRHERFNPTWKN